jgi:hypothetical protein
VASGSLFDDSWNVAKGFLVRHSARRVADGRSPAAAAFGEPFSRHFRNSIPERGG